MKKDNKSNDRFTLSTEMAIEVMKIYDWSPRKIISYAKIGDINFDEEEFLKVVNGK
jgi:hypothetical protein